MKKNFIYLLLLFNLIAQAQITPSYPTIKLTKTIEGVKHDSLLVVATDKTVKHIPFSKITSVLEYTTASALPVTGVAGKLYITKDNNKIYTWNGTFYSEFVGAKGDKGDQGIQGFKGDTGLTGADGAMGVQGPQGIQGETGLRGIQGETGPQGPIGFTGEKGADGTGVSIKGSFDNTSQLPASGADGDAYLISGNLHVWNGTAWVNVGNIQGPQGLIGLTGATGSQGIQGAKGEKGDQGIQGIQGLKGDTGAKGDTGSFNGDITADQVNETATRKYQTANQAAYNDATSSIQTQLNSKEPSFAKNTAFNKSFGTTAGTVAEGNDSRILNGQTAFSWGNHAGKYPLYNGTGATGTWPISVSGNAASATNWGGRPANLNAIQTDFDLVLTRGAADAVTRLTPLPQFRTWLGLGSNAYSSTAFLPLSGGTVTGNFKLNGLLLSDNFTGVNPQVLNPTATVLYLGNSSLTNINYEVGTRHEFYIGGSVKGRFNSTGLFVDGTVTASPATLPNHAVVKSQLDAVANIAGTSGSYTPSLSNLTNISNSSFDSASYTKIGNVVTARVSLFITAVTPSVTAVLDFLLPVPRVSTNVTGIGLGSSFEASMVVNTNSNTTTARLSYKPLVSTNHQVVVMFQYIVD